ncbi:TIGR02391 family protein [Thermodesulfovibrio thiophilus]|uniref:TIGR02391 family protein n=1 Tax=Thermodesulfovibrio thiophilus TaxID=340095 RepID=UPI0017D10F92|nr:TIGR02391 family protein [Thermodesulfovibrio thiophilus]HHW20518.1 TIGR02391 family protein [Thermodesulfovibrio thiophilus]
MKKIEPFSLSALERIAKIIGERYRGSEITELFRKAGFFHIRHDGSTKWRFVCAALEELQKQPYGPYNVAKVIEKLCDPQEYFGQAEYHKSNVEKVNEILAYYGLEVNLKTGKITVKSSISPTLHSQRSKAEEMFDSRNFHPDVRTHARPLFVEGKNFHAVFECCKAFDKYIQEKSGINKHGVELMGAALSLKGPLKINDQRTETERNEQEGVMYLCIGLMRAIRNPEAHEPELDWPITQEDSLNILSLISFLWQKIDIAVCFEGTT